MASAAPHAARDSDSPSQETEHSTPDPWQDALDVWGVRVNLSPPIDLPPSERLADIFDEPLAYINLEDRQIYVNFRLLDVMDATSSLTAVVAHEIGHHVRFPHTLSLLAHLELMQQKLLPSVKQSLTNLFLDLQVNEVVGRTFADELCTVYRNAGRLKDSGNSPLFTFYLAIYEELWGKPPGALVDQDYAEEMDEEYPGWRGEARMFVQTFYGLTDTYLQFAYFCSRVYRYIDPTEDEFGSLVLDTDVPDASIEDYASVLDGVPQVDRALEEAEERGWIEGESEPESTAQDDVFDVIDELSQRGHGLGEAEFKRALVDRHYQRLVERHLFDPPPLGDDDPEPFIPTTVSPWETGEDPKRIDWIESVIRSGPMAVATPVKRDLEPDLDTPELDGVPSVEIYLDTSGSMPNPVRGFNAMTLAALVLSTATLRHDGKVRAVIYSYGDPLVSDWMYDEATAREFLLQYAGGGTYFPFDVLEEFSEDSSDVVRVVVSDSGFQYDMKREEAPDALRRAVSRSRSVILLLLLWHLETSNATTVQQEFERDIASIGARLVKVANATELASAAADLAAALWDEAETMER